MYFPVFQFVPIASWPAPGHHWDNPGFPFISPYRYLNTWLRGFRAFSSPGGTTPAFSSSPCTSHAPNHSASSWLFTALTAVPNILGSQGLDPALQLWPPQCWQEKKDHILNLYLVWYCSWCSPGVAVGPACHKNRLDLQSCVGVFNKYHRHSFSCNEEIISCAIQMTAE